MNISERIWKYMRPRTFGQFPRINHRQVDSEVKDKMGGYREVDSLADSNQKSYD